MARRFLAFTVLALALAACSRDVPSAATDDTTARPSAPSASEASLPETTVPDGSLPITAVGDLIGEYRVAGIDGTELGGDMGIAVSIDGPTLSYEPTCAGFVWNIADERGELAFTRAPGFGPVRQPDGSVVVCAVAVPVEFRRLGQAIDSAKRAWRTPANGILLEGGEHSVLLFSQ